MTLPRGWVEVELGEITPPDAPIIYGILQPGPDLKDGVPYIRPTEIDDGGILAGQLRRTSPKISARYRRSMLQPNDVVLTIVGTIGKTALIPAQLAGANITQSSCRVRPEKMLVDEHFLNAFLRSPPAFSQYDERRLGTAVPRLNIADIRKFRFLLPPKSEQHRIVAKLHALKASVVRARSELTEASALHRRQRQSHLRAGVTGAYTSADAVETGEGIDELLARVGAPTQGRGGREATDKVIEGAAGLSVNDPGKALPAGWSWVPLLRVARQETGHTPSRSHPEYWDGGIPWIGIRDAGAHHGRRISQTMQTISQAGLENSSARLLPAGTVCLSRTASVGYVTIMDRPMATSQDFATWTCSEALLPEYLMYALMAEGEDIRKFGMGSTHTTIYFPEIRALHIALPPLAVQRGVAAQLKSAIARADRLEDEATRALALLDRLEAAILAKAFRGELVPQDPSDEPATVMLERIRAARAASPKTTRKRRMTAG